MRGGVRLFKITCINRGFDEGRPRALSRQVLAAAPPHVAHAPRAHSTTEGPHTLTARRSPVRISKVNNVKLGVY
jgi:hypothetical protein